MKNSVIAWVGFGIFSISLVMILLSELSMAESKPNFVPGEMTHGHAQIEMACSSCHEEPFGGDLIQSACEGCHSEALKTAQDTHPKSKFTDPRNADRLAKIEARECVSCHREHVEEQTFAMGVTLPEDFCFLCHEEISKDRPSHEGLGFDTCASSGCHNYHDNRALYENFLLEHQDEADILDSIRHTFLPNQWPKVRSKNSPLSTKMMTNSDPVIVAEFQASAHALGGMDCAHCHVSEQPDMSAATIVATCGDCHTQQSDTFALGKHGMKLAAGLGEMSVADARLPMHENPAHDALDCASCHDPHTQDLNLAKTNACLGCHADDHSQSFETSPHALLTDEFEVNCSTCHMPRVDVTLFGVTQQFTTHNQNENLQPNEQMIRSVCMNCHGLGFAIDALADPALIHNNFNGQPQQHIESLDMAIKRDKRTGGKSP